MAGHPIEIILMRQLASYLAVPILLVDRNLDLLFFNESAEPILGRRFDETGEIRRGEWTRLLRPSDEDGHPIAPGEQPLALAIDRNQPSFRRSWVTGLDGVPRAIEGLAFPLETRESGLLGAAGIFWEAREGAAPEHSAVRGSSQSTHPVEVVLLRRLAERLTMPTFVIDPDERLLFYNPAAEPLIGRPFAQVGRADMTELYDNFQPTDEDGSLLKREDHPLQLALRTQRPSHRRFFYRALDGVKRGIDGTAFPLLGQCNRHLGSAGIFWEEPG